MKNITTARIQMVSVEVSAAESKLVDIDALLARNSSGEVVLTKGVFDLIHRGHLHLMEYCARLKATLGGALVVAVASDEVVRRKKGNQRPVQHQKERALQVAALGAVDFVVIADESPPMTIIKSLRPRVYVKGMDTAGVSARSRALTDERLTIDSVHNPEAKILEEYGGEFVVFVDDGKISTTSLIEHIVRVFGNSAR